MLMMNPIERSSTSRIVGMTIVALLLPLAALTVQAESPTTGDALADSTKYTVHTTRGVTSMSVSYADLDLSQARDMVTLNARIANAADAVCSAKDLGRSLGQDTAQRRCRDASLARAAEQVNAISTPNDAATD